MSGSFCGQQCTMYIYDHVQHVHVHVVHEMTAKLSCMYVVLRTHACVHVFRSAAHRRGEVLLGGSDSPFPMLSYQHHAAS